MAKTQTIEQIINQRRIINGPEDKVRAIRPVKYNFTTDLLAQMKKNTWGPEEIGLTRDINDFRTKLSPGQRTMLSRILAFLSNLDALQLNNLAVNIAPYITAPEIKYCLYRQTWEEVIHVQAYSLMVEALYENPLEIYDMYRHNTTLSTKNDFILTQADKIRTEGFTPERFLYALISNMVLEGLYFFSGFLGVYSLGRTNLMMGCCDNVRYIQRDELTHLDLFVKIFWAFKQENPKLFTAKVIDNCRMIMDDGVKLETAWGSHTIEDGVLGLTPPIIGQFLQSRGDAILEMVGMEKLYNVQTPVPWFDRFSIVGEGNASNVFETRVTEYQSGGGGALEW